MKNSTRSKTLSTSSNFNTRNTQDRKNTSSTKSLQKVTKTSKGLKRFKGSKRQQQQLKGRKLSTITSEEEEEKDDEQIEQIAFRESIQKKLKEMEEDFQRRQNEKYEEKLNQLNQDIINVRQGSSPVIKEELQKFINKHDEELGKAQMKRDYYLKCIQKEYEEEIQLVENDEQIEQIAFRESIQKKLKEMEEDFQRRQNEKYEEKLNQLNQDIINVRQGSSPVIKEELQKFINKHDEELGKAQMKRDYYLKCIQKEYEEEIQLVESYYSRKRKEIDDALVGDIKARKKMLLEDIKAYDQINVQDGELKGHVYAIPVRILRSKTKTTLNSDTQEKNNKSKRFPERPCVSEKLNDYEIERDLAKIYMGTVSSRVDTLRSKNKNRVNKK
ncbi:hypothetical protein Glove_103g214 [Diversispora epigaea]|uniref:Uncharacterized protein n=1 Tax=Diversispora epigaea TaxID=1348612 RepID=A0A397JCV7_9GLOM|nr:hypothetical protein Glove_103g214 [Diversispora epigaea]